MERALYDPAHGYYAGGRAAIGKKGDFITSVSVGSVFGRLLAMQFEDLWQQMGRPAEFTLVEQGANNGDFAYDVLTANSISAEFRAALQYRIVEPFAINATRQRERLHGLPVAWSDSLETVPPFTGVHFSNELVDALPVHVVVYRSGNWMERHVAVSGAEFVWADAPLSTPALEPFLAHLPCIEGYQTEINLAAHGWLRAVAARLERGFVLIADYGFSRDDYYLPERREGTLTGYAQHQRVENVLAHPGEQDLTAHVEFTSLQETAAAVGLKTLHFNDQHHFLIPLGARLFPDATGPISPEHQRDLRALATLIHPSLMGRAFQFLLLGT
jgi:SAM-dependent MidA family methyltransferase